MAQKIQGDLQVLRTLDARRVNQDIDTQTVSTSYAITQHNPGTLVATVSAGNNVISLPAPGNIDSGIGWQVVISITSASTTDADIQDAGGSTVKTLPAGSTAIFELINSSGNGTWTVVESQTAITTLPELTTINGSAVDFSGGSLTVAGNSTIDQNVSTTATPTFANVIGTSAPTLDSHLVRKDYVDSVAAGFDPKESVLVATTASIGNGQGASHDNLSGLLTIDGVTLQESDRVLVKNQSNSVYNGIWTASSSVWNRAADFDGSPANEVTGGAFTFVEAGTSNGNTGWVIVNSGTVDVGTDNITWTQFSDSASITAGSGLIKNGNAIDLLAGNGIKITGSDEVAVEPADFAGTGLEDDGSDNLRIAASAAGNGLTGGGGSALSVGAGSGIIVDATTVSVDIASIAGDALVTDGTNLDVNAGTGLEISNDSIRIAATAAGDGLSGGGGSALSVNTGTGLEINADTVRIATSAAGNGLTGGGGSALAVGAGSGIIVDATTVSVDAASLAGDGLSTDGTNIDVNVDSTTIEINSDTLRLAASAAGNGLTGGGGSALAVGAGDGITVNASSVDVDVTDIVGTGVEDDGANNIRLSAQGDGITGGGGSLLSVDAGSGIVVNSNGVNVLAGSGIIVNEDGVHASLSILDGQGLIANGDQLDVNTGKGLKIDTDQVAIEPADFAGTGLEDDGSDNMRIAASAAGNGLTGGGGSALAVGAGSGIIVDATTVSVDLASIAGDALSTDGTNLDVNAGTGLEISSDTIRIAAAAAGNGLTGGAGSALAVGAGNGITVNADDIAVTAGSGIVVNSNGVNVNKYINLYNNTTDWSTASGFSTVTITAATHGFSTDPIVTTFESQNASDVGVAHASVDHYQEVIPNRIDVASNGDVTIQVVNDGSVDGRFYMKVVIQ